MSVTSEKVFAVISFCGGGSLSLWTKESEAREYLALIAYCGPGCAGLHKVVQIGLVIA